MLATKTATMRSMSTPRSAMLATLRNAAGLTQQDCADLLDTSVQQLRRWESGAKTPPVGVLNEMHELLVDMARFAELEVQEHENRPESPIVLFRYRSDADRALQDGPATGEESADLDSAETSAPDRGLSLPVVSQAIATWHAMQQLQRAGHQVDFVWFDTRHYGPWLGHRPDTMATRRLWARTATASNGTL